MERVNIFAVLPYPSRGLQDKNGDHKVVKSSVCLPWCVLMLP